MKNSSLILLIVLSFFFSCKTHKMTVSSKLKPYKLIEGTYIVPFDATIKGNVIKVDENGNFKVLSEVSPDAIVTSVTDLTSKLTAKLSKGDSLSAEQLTKITESVSELGRRTVAVNILRDALYRLEEFNINSNKPMDNKTHSLFKEILSISSEIAKAEIKNEEVKVQQEKTKQDAIALKESTINSTTDEKYDLAITFEKEGFNHLLNDNYQEALTSFRYAEKAYPTFHSVYEIIRTLKRNMDKLKNNDKKEKIKLFEKILRSYIIPTNEIKKEIKTKLDALKQKK